MVSAFIAIDTSEKMIGFSEEFILTDRQKGDRSLTMIVKPAWETARIEPV